MSKLEQVQPIKQPTEPCRRTGSLPSLHLLLLFQTNAEQQTKIQDLQEKLSKVAWIRG